MVETDFAREIRERDAELAEEDPAGGVEYVTSSFGGDRFYYSGPDESEHTLHTAEGHS